jgi:hypothetical protein
LYKKVKGREGMERKRREEKRLARKGKESKVIKKITRKEGKGSGFDL